MGERGPAKKPRLQIIREGNPGKRPVPEALELPPAKLEEPNWHVWFTTSIDDAFGADKPAAGIERRYEDDEMCRDTASRAWRTVHDMLESQGMIADVDVDALTDYCLCVARLLQCERDISRRGMSWSTEKGEMANPSVRAANLYRTSMRNYARKFGLTPSDRNGLSPKGGGRGGETGPLDV